jgi:hypothetical protein
MARTRKVRQRANRDANHTDIVGVFEALGASWMETYQLPNELDGVVGIAKIDQRVEIKNPDQPKAKRALTASEVDTFMGWKGRPPVIIETAQDAIDLVNKLRKEACHAGTKI